MPRNSQLLSPLRKVAVFVDGIPATKLGEYHAAPLIHLISLAHHQLEEEGRPTVHFPEIEPGVARHILEFAENAWTQKPQNAEAIHLPSSGDMVRDIEIYVRMLQFGMRDVVRRNFGDNIRPEFARRWRHILPKDIQKLNHLFGACRIFPKVALPSLIQEPVLTMVVRTLAYGIQQGHFIHDTLIARELMECHTLKEAIHAVGEIRYPVRRLVASPVIHELPKRRRRVQSATKEGGGKRGLISRNASSIRTCEMTQQTAPGVAPMVPSAGNAIDSSSSSLNTCEPTFRVRSHVEASSMPPREASSPACHVGRLPMAESTQSFFQTSAHWNQARNSTNAHRTVYGKYGAFFEGYRIGSRPDLVLDGHKCGHTIRGFEGLVV